MSDKLTIAEFKALNKSKISKYRNKITVVDDISFHSKKEAARYGKLKLLVKSGDVTDFKMQVRYPIEVNGIKITTYIADFVVTWKSGNVVVEDVKGIKTPMFNIKLKLMKAVYGITIKII